MSAWPYIAERYGMAPWEPRVAVELARCLPPVPGREYIDGGWGWMAELERTTAWEVVPSWGREGWDAGRWPLVVIATCAVVIPVDDRPVRVPASCIGCGLRLSRPGPVWVSRDGADCPVYREHRPGRQPRAYGVASYVEGDVWVRPYASHDDRVCALGEVITYHWRLDDTMPEVPLIGPLPVEYTRPFWWSRVEPEQPQ